MKITNENKVEKLKLTNEADEETIAEAKAEIQKNNINFPKSESIRIMGDYNKGKELKSAAENYVKSMLKVEKINEGMVIDALKNADVKAAIGKTAVDDFYKGMQLTNKAKEEMINNLSQFVFWVISHNFRTFTKYNKDLYQEGIIGILKGMDKYDAEMSKATTYFYVYILHEINEFINETVNKTSTHYSTHITKVKRAINAFDKANRPWTVKDLAQETNISPETIMQALKIIERSDEVHYDSLASIEGKVSETYDSPEDKYLKSESKTTLYDAIERLTDEERSIIILKHGLGNNDPMSYKSIFETTGIPVHRIKRLYNQALIKLRNNKQMKKTFRNHLAEQQALNDGNIGVIPAEMSEEMMDDLSNYSNGLLFDEEK